MVGELFQNCLANFDSRFSDWHHAVKTERNEGDGEGKPGFAAKFSWEPIANANLRFMNRPSYLDIRDCKTLHRDWYAIDAVIYCVYGRKSFFI